MKVSVFRDLNTLYPGRINNKTNGITPRRWLHTINPDLSALLAEAGGPETLDNAELLTRAAGIENNAQQTARFAAIILTFTPVFLQQRTWRRAELLLIGAILAPGKRTVTSLLRITGLRYLRARTAIPLKFGARLAIAVGSTLTRRKAT